ncbi:MAG: hypothetical protein LBC73_03215 [Oscillospiraceae bacterium]|jgi:hypothetical protein|nr:hypothetical protein [Oscillospiraceae bacterium]
MYNYYDYGYGSGFNYTPFIYLAVGIIVFIIVMRIIRSGKRKKLQGNSLSEQGFISMRGRTSEQKSIIKYFMSTGILGLIFNISDNVFDSILLGKISNCMQWINARALNIHGIDIDEVKEISPILISNYSSDSRYSKVFKDGVFRASEYQMTYLLFGEKQMYAYCNTFDMTSANMTERTREYFYEDITNIDVTQKKIELLNPRPAGYTIGGIASILAAILFFFALYGLGKVMAISCVLLGIYLIIFPGYTRSLVNCVILKFTVSGSDFECDITPDDVSAIQGMKAKIREKKR